MCCCIGPRTPEDYYERGLSYLQPNCLGKDNLVDAATCFYNATRFELLDAAPGAEHAIIESEYQLGMIFKLIAESPCGSKRFEALHGKDVVNRIFKAISIYPNLDNAAVILRSLASKDHPQAVQEYAKIYEKMQRRWKDIEAYQGQNERKREKEEEKRKLLEANPELAYLDRIEANQREIIANQQRQTATAHADAVAAADAHGSAATALAREVRDIKFQQMMTNFGW